MTNYIRAYLKIAPLMAALSLFIFTLSACGGAYLNNEEKNLAYIKITPGTPDVTAGGQINFSAKGIDGDGGSLIISPIWEAHDGRIDSNGVYIAPSYATIDRVTAFVEAKTATAVINVKTHPEAVQLKIYPELKTLSCGAKQKFRAAGFNAFGEEVAVSVRWECRAGNITADGEYSAPLHPAFDAIGVKTISASGALPLEIQVREAYKIFISPSKAIVKASGVTKFNAAAFDIYGNKITGEPAFRFNAIKGKITDEGYYFAPNIIGTDEVGVVLNYIRDSAEIELTN